MLFDLFQLVCPCGAQSEPLKFYEMVHYISANALVYVSCTYHTGSYWLIICLITSSKFKSLNLLILTPLNDVFTVIVTCTKKRRENYARIYCKQTHTHSSRLHELDKEANSSFQKRMSFVMSWFGEDIKSLVNWTSLELEFYSV